MAIQKDVKIQFIEEKRGEAIQKIEQEIKNLNKNLTDLKQTNLQLKKDFGASSQEYIDGKKKEIQAIADLKAKSKELSTINKQYSAEIKSASTEIKQLKKDEADAKKKFDKDFQDFVKRNEDIAGAYAKKKSDERKKIAKDEADAKKKFDKDFQDFVKRNETLANSSKIKTNENTAVKFRDATYPEFLKKLQFELKLLGVEQAKLVQSGQRETQQFQMNKQKIQELTAEYKSLKREMKGLEPIAKLTKLQIMEYAENFSVVAFAVKSAVTGLFDLGKNALTEGAKLKVLQDNFKGTREELVLLKQASADTVEESKLISIYNKASKQIKLTTDETARLLAQSEDLADDGIGDLISNFDAYINAILTGGRGLNSMGISQKMFKDDLKATALQMGINMGLIEDTNEEEDINISKLDAKTQKVLVLKTLFDNGYVPSLQNVINKQKDGADKLEAMRVKMKEAEASVGQFMMRGVEPLIDGFLRMGKGGTVAVGALSGIMGYALILIPIIGNLRLAFMGLGSTAVLSSIGAVGGKIASLLTPIGIVTAAVLALSNLLVRVQNLLKGRGFTDDPMNDLSDDATARQKAIDSLSKQRKVDTKMGKITEKYLPAEITDEDIKLRMYELRNKDKMEADKRKYETEKKIKDDRENLSKDLDNMMKDSSPGGSNSGGNEEEKITTDLIRLQEELKNVEKEFEVVKQQVTSGILPEDSVEVKNYTKRIDDLNVSIKFLQTSLKDLQKIPDTLSPVTLPGYKDSGEEIKPIKLSDAENIMLNGKDKNEEQNKILSSEDYKAAEFMLGQLSNFFERTMSSAWESIFGKADNFATQFLQDFASQLLSMFANWGLRNLLNSIFPGAGIVTSFFGGGRAAGGDVNPGKFYMVGERGPELIAPKSQGTVIPTNAIMEALKANTSTQAPQVVYVPVPVLSDISGNNIKLSYDRTNKFIKNIKT